MASAASKISRRPSKQSPTRKPRKTFRRGIPANQNQRIPLNNARKALGGLGRKALAGASGAAMLGWIGWELYDLNKNAPAKFQGQQTEDEWDLSGWTNLSGGECMPPKGLNSRVANPPCGVFGTVLRPDWEAEEGLMINNLNSTVARLYGEALYEPPGWPGDVRYLLASRWIITHPAGENKTLSDIYTPGIDTLSLAPMPNPVWLPTVDPLSWPYEVPMGTPQPWPHTLIPHIRSNPWRAPQYQRNSGYQHPDIYRQPRHWPVDAVPFAYPPVQVGTRATPLPRFHRQRPPARNEKEHKTRVNSAAGRALLYAVNGISEGIDLVEAIYKALDWRVKPKFRDTFHVRYSVTPQEKLRLLYQHADKIDPVQAIHNIIAENTEDRIYATLGRAQAQFARDAGLGVSLQHGGGYRRYLQTRARHAKSDQEE